MILFKVGFFEQFAEPNFPNNNGFADFLQRCFLLREGGKANDKCPITIADLVLMHSRYMEGLYGSSKNGILTFDFYAGMSTLKPQLIKY
mmetsp:Transcript_18897/g.39834  ORF Transcript_18897/g.39834 Transcript_18897/m.39834 type:complete len:89 (+) Transcript_18897:1259-1525(+)